MYWSGLVHVVTYPSEIGCLPEMRRRDLGLAWKPLADWWWKNSYPE